MCVCGCVCVGLLVSLCGCCDGCLCVFGYKYVLARGVDACCEVSLLCAMACAMACCVWGCVQCAGCVLVSSCVYACVCICVGVYGFVGVCV